MLQDIGWERQHFAELKIDEAQPLRYTEGSLGRSGGALMKQRKPSGSSLQLARQGVVSAEESSFAEVLRYIDEARQRAFQSVNSELVYLYWRVGAYISRKLETAEWGEGLDSCPL